MSNRLHLAARLPAKDCQSPQEVKRGVDTTLASLVSQMGPPHPTITEVIEELQLASTQLEQSSEQMAYFALCGAKGALDWEGSWPELLRQINNWLDSLDGWQPRPQT